MSNNWTLNDLEELDELTHQGKRDAEIARRLGRTATAVQVIRKRRHMPSVTVATLNARKVGRLLGKDNSVVCSWCGRGMLAARRSVTRGSNQQWCIEEDALIAFLADPETWMCWTPDTITDAGLREWAREVRTFEWVSAADVADRFAVGITSVRIWVRRGLLPGIHRAGTTWIPGPALEGFEPPYARSKAGMQRRGWTGAEDARLRRLRAAGWAFATIADAMGRSTGSVSNRWYRVGQPVAAVAA